LARQQRYFWTVEECVSVTATEACGRFPQTEVAASNRADPWDGSGFLRLGATGVAYVATPCRFGGGRFWLLCPTCQKAVYKLYAPPPGEVYACRACHGLTYESSRLGSSWWGLLHRGFRSSYELETVLKRPGRKPKRYSRLLAQAQELERLVHGSPRRPL